MRFGERAGHPPKKNPEAGVSKNENESKGNQHFGQFVSFDPAKKPFFVGMALVTFGRFGTIIALPLVAPLPSLGRLGTLLARCPLVGLLPILDNPGMPFAVYPSPAGFSLCRLPRESIGSSW